MMYGEYMQGVVKGEKKNILFINMGWGLGLSIFINGELYYGKSGFSGEFGHFCFFDNEILCHCGKRDVLKPKHPALPCIVSCWNVTAKVAVLFSLRK